MLKLPAFGSFLKKRPSAHRRVFALVDFVMNCDYPQAQATSNKGTHTMNINKLGPIILFVILALNLSACNTERYTTNLNTPRVDQTIDDTFPKSFAGLNRTLVPLSLEGNSKGFRAEYGLSTASIEIIKTPTEQDSIKYFEQEMLPRFRKFPNNGSSKSGSRWIAKAITPKREVLYGWSNKEWAFLVKANSEQSFSDLVDAFPFISKSK